MLSVLKISFRKDIDLFSFLEQGIKSVSSPLSEQSQNCLRSKKVVCAFRQNRNMKTLASCQLEYTVGCVYAHT